MNINNIKKPPLFKLSIPNLVGEYSYFNSLGKLEISAISFRGIFVKLPQIIPFNDMLEIRFSLEENGEIFWSEVTVIKLIENITYLEFSRSIPLRTKERIAYFIDKMALKQISNTLNSPEQHSKPPENEFI